MNKVVKLEDVEKLIKLIKERDVWNDWTSSWEECNKKIENHIYLIRNNAIEINEQFEIIAKE